ncbi:hypothetical protein TPHA_0A04190 [Tetrapisispora phaffii CBS 4417]|uniref:Thioredoxin domain-containing protein n=1 Tax=Tetrapisispora phaffii (strain ATCC 24235 / CBS 4417 / NBRC 1672 / NRRL Y-8282 / UCD 70-5) TaxID=1071381 RepID=G8BNL6_TETPH|nr:hypothetical protein TPHA_0A04190 [Tetrapisispora phaffii CBS 4417]CCE61494.1 hypothetical protein TPHA_0A04190 [Tetrapisispora phaffii CBS 4417]
MFRSILKNNQGLSIINKRVTNIRNPNSFRLLSNNACHQLQNNPLDSKSNKISPNNTKTSTDDITFKSKKPLSRVPIGVDGNSGYRNGNERGNENVNGVNSGSIEFSTWKAGILFIIVGSALSYFFQKEKKRLEVEREAEANRGYGKPLIGGPFKLINSATNEEFTEKDLLNKWSLIYFGFTHCPDICPDELDKLGIWLNTLKSKHNIEIQPIFITCDPARDSPDVIKEYLKDFHEDIIGLTGDYDSIKDVCKKYRVYFSTPPGIQPTQDYLVDHSVFFYLMDPEGNFAQVLGLNSDEVTGVENIKEYVDNFVPTAERQKRDETWYAFLFK